VGLLGDGDDGHNIKKELKKDFSGGVESKEDAIGAANWAGSFMHHSVLVSGYGMAAVGCHPSVSIEWTRLGGPLVFGQGRQIIQSLFSLRYLCASCLGEHDASLTDHC
jgi:hypothetical protein